MRRRHVVAIVLDRAHEISQLRSVELVGAVPHAKASEFHVDLLLKMRSGAIRLRFRERCNERAQHFCNLSRQCIWPSRRGKRKIGLLLNPELADPPPDGMVPCSKEN